MAKKHEMSEQEYLVYKKQHSDEDAVAAEEGKIRRERAAYVQHRRKGEARLLQTLRNVATPEDVEELDEDLEQPEEEQAAARVLRNSQTHKRRLVGLRKHEDRSSSEDV